MTTVVNLRKEPFDVYIGRAGHGHDGTFGNPFSQWDRATNIAKFREYFLERIQQDRDFKSKVLSLKGKRLGCFCKPKDCHGDIIAEYLNNIVLEKLKYAVIGSRTFTDYDFLVSVLKFHNIDEIISGGARGADSLAKLYGQRNSIKVVEFLPQWDIYGKSAGFRRNKLIIDACDEVIAFWDGASKGTKISIDLAKEQGKPVHIYWPDRDTIAEIGL